MEDSITPLLPVLTDSDLRAIFRTDERAIWRYHVLAALLLEGQSAREAASRFGATVETVRNLRTTFLATGHLDALRSKRRGAAGHLSRQTPLAQAVARELAADPAANGGTIWRRVQLRLSGRGIKVPRRSVYRLIERLRPASFEPELPESANDLWAPALVPAIRTALPLLRLEPPIDLGRSDLANQLLSHESDPLARGTHLRTLIQRALDELRPPAEVDPQDPAARPYQVLVGEALRGLTRDELQRELAIATATYTRAKRQGLDQLAEFLVQNLQQPQVMPRTSAPPAPPLLGREAPLNYYSERLEDEGEAVIWGLAGSGKTALAATLAAQQQAAGELVTWHVCSGSGDGLLRALLTSFGMTDVGKRLDTEALLALIREQLRAGGLLVLDAYESIADDPTTTLLMAAIRVLVGQRALKLLIVGRQLPTWAKHQGWLPLGGLVEDMARALWTITGGSTPEMTSWYTIYNRTLGYPQLLQMLASNAAVSLEHFLLSQASEGLSARTRHVLYQAILAHRPLSAYSRAKMTDDPGLQRAYNELRQRGLLTYQADQADYHLHGLLRANRSELAAIVPDSAAQYRELAERASGAEQWLDMAQYLVAAGDLSAALRGIGEHEDRLVLRRQGRNAIDLLRRLLLQFAPGPELAQIQAQLGALHLALGAEREALDALGTALELATVFRTALPPLEVRRWHRLAAEAYLRRGQWDRALSYAQISMGSERSVTSEVVPHERITLTLLQHQIWLTGGQIDQARYWLADAQMQARALTCPDAAALVAYAEGLAAMRHGAFDVAEQQLRRALESLPPEGRHTERFDIQAHLARCFAAVGNVDAARDYARASWSRAQALRHRSGTVALTLALVEIMMGTGAIDEAWAVLGLAEELLDATNPRLNAAVAVARGWLTLHTPDSWGGRRHFTEAIALVSNPPIPELLAEANFGLAVLYLQQGDASTAAQFAQRAVRFAASADAGRIKTLALLCLGRIAILQRAFDEAESISTSMQGHAADLLTGGTALRLLAELQAARGARDAAEATFRQSLDALKFGPVLARTWVEQSYATFLSESQADDAGAPALRSMRQRSRAASDSTPLGSVPPAL